MRAMLLRRAGRPLEAGDVPEPAARAGQLKIAVEACAVCRTDLHVADGELGHPKLPLVLGHEIVGRVVEVGDSVDAARIGSRVGVPWLGWTCGQCAFCARGLENLCDAARFTGYQIDGGFAEATVADARYCFPLASDGDGAALAPLLCAGLIGYRSLTMCGDAERIGIYGFGAAAHIVTQVARHQGREVGAFTRPGDAAAQRFARALGAAWALGSDEPPPAPLDAAVVFAPIGALVPQALRAIRKGGIVVCGGIHMSDVPSFPYADLWGERTLKSVANLTRRDGEEFLALAPTIPIRTSVRRYPLERANEALADLRQGRVEGAAVLVP
jgi:propanol-preferring alcohol dehydrogenase